MAGKIDEIVKKAPGAQETLESNSGQKGKINSEFLESKRSSKKNCDVPLEKIVPAFESDNVTVVTSSSNYYLPFVGVWLRSIMDNASPEHNYDIIILQEGIAEENKRLLLSIVEGAENFSVRFVDVSKKLSTLDSNNWNHTTRLTFARMLIPEYFPDYSKAMWLDGDIVAERDVADLFYTNLEGKLLAAVPEARAAGLYNRTDRAIRWDVTQKKLQDDILQMRSPYQYFNAGVVIMDLERFREKYTTEELIALANRKDFVWLDQDALNYLGRDDLLILKTPWNFTVTNVLCQEGHSEEPYAPDWMYQNWLEAAEDPWLVHYAGRQIPCFVPHAQLFEHFWKYARKTPYYEMIIQRMIQEEIQKSQQERENEIAELKKTIKDLRSGMSSLAASLEEIGAKVEIPEVKFTEQAQRESAKAKFKRRFFMPAVNLLWPKDTVRRNRMKKFYFKLRGWEIT